MRHAAWSRQTCDEAGSDCVVRHREYGRDDRRRLFHCGDCLSPRDNDIDLKPDKLARDLGVAFGARLRPAIFDRDGATLAPAELV